jgi:hypothetical protein
MSRQRSFASRASLTVREHRSRHGLYQAAVSQNQLVVRVATYAHAYSNIWGPVSGTFRHIDKREHSLLRIFSLFLHLCREASNNKSCHRTFNDMKIETLHSEIATEASLRTTVLSSRRTCHSFPETYLYFSYMSA